MQDLQHGEADDVDLLRLSGDLVTCYIYKQDDPAVNTCSSSDVTERDTFTRGFRAR